MATKQNQPTTKALTTEEVLQRLKNLLKEKYKDDADLMALKLKITSAYLNLFLTGKRLPPNWLLSKLGVKKKRHVVIELFEAA